MLMLKYREVQGTAELVRDREDFDLGRFEISRFYCSTLGVSTNQRIETKQ